MKSECVDVLLDHGADPTATNDTGQTLADLARHTYRQHETAEKIDGAIKK